MDYLKYDLCGQGNLQPFVTFQVMRDALNASGRRMVYSCEPQQLRAEPIAWPPHVANLFRTAADMGAVCHCHCHRVPAPARPPLVAPRRHTRPL